MLGDFASVVVSSMRPFLLWCGLPVEAMAVVPTLLFVHTSWLR